jgi:hypothetical protein
MTHIFTRRSSGIFAPEPEPLILPPSQIGLRANCIATLNHWKSGKEQGRWEFHNKLVDVYMNALMTNTAAFPGVAVETDANNFFAAGTGTTPPAAGNTALVAEIAGGRAATTMSGGYLAGPPDYCFATRTGTFSTSQANGTIGEFGWLDASSGGNMRARSVPKDTSGNQTTITKTSGSTLTLQWSIYIFLIQSDSILSRTIGGTAYTVTVRAIGANNTNPLFYIISRGPQWGGSSALGARSAGGLVARTSSAASGSGISASSDAYVNGTYTRTINFTLFNGLSAFQFLTNTGGTSGDAFANIQMGFSPAIVGSPSLKVRVNLTPL